jgi:hypothetical protein
MCIHFDTELLAIAHLQAQGFKQIKNGSWVSDDGTVAARIHPINNSPVVAVMAWEI